MNSLKVILTGIVLILSSLFLLGIYIINSGGTGLPSLLLFILGIIVSIIGLFFIHDDNDDEEYDDEEYDDEENDDEENDDEE